MLTVDQARELVLGRARRLPPRPIPLDEALGAVLAADVVSDLDVPPFDKALVDGYALRSADAAAGVASYRVVEEVVAGHWPTRPIGAGETTLVMTGAPLPEGADAVVMHERTRREGKIVHLDTGEVRPGQNRLTRGRELRAGEVVAHAGQRLITPAWLGLLATVGYHTVVATPRPEVAILPTGNELVEPDRVPGPGQIRNSNGAMLAGLVAEAGGRPRVLPIALDEPGPLRELLAEGLRHDVLLVTGGVSAGTLDLVPDALTTLGVERVFHKIRLKPGKPLWFGVGPARGAAPGTLVFGLPGNPVSGLVGFLLFVRPTLRVMAGLDPVAGYVVDARLGRPFDHRGDRPTFHPAHAHRDTAGHWVVDPLDWAGSADLRTVAGADGFAVFPAGDRRHEAGEIVGYLPLQ